MEKAGSIVGSEPAPCTLKATLGKKRECLRGNISLNVYAVIFRCKFKTKSFFKRVSLKLLLMFLKFGLFKKTSF